MQIDRFQTVPEQFRRADTGWIDEHNRHSAIDRFCEDLSRTAAALRRRAWDA